jgi:D-aminopeptidase
MQKRFRTYGFKIGFLPTGTRNSIADVRGVRVGNFTNVQGSSVRTGITLIDPGVKNLFIKKLPAAIAIGNGYGKLAGYTQVEEVGTLETPIALTNTLSVGPVLQGLNDLVIKTTPRIGNRPSINGIVADVNDGFLNNLRKKSLSPDDVATAYKNLSSDFALGNIGGGTGSRAFSWKGGIGTASRRIRIKNKTYLIGALVQTNYGGSLTILGIPIGRLLGITDFDPLLKKSGAGSCITVVATDAPLTSRQLKRIGSRSFIGLARTGSILNTTSGDYAIAFSTDRSGLEGSGSIGRCVAEDDLGLFFLATAEATEEAIYDALFAARTMRGRDGNTLSEIPKKKVISLLTKYVPKI